MFFMKELSFSLDAKREGVKSWQLRGGEERDGGRGAYEVCDTFVACVWQKRVYFIRVIALLAGAVPFAAVRREHSSVGNRWRGSRLLKIVAKA